MSEASYHLEENICKPHVNIESSFLKKQQKDEKDSMRKWAKDINRAFTKDNIQMTKSTEKDVQIVSH